MATVQSYFPGKLYPADYETPFEDWVDEIPGPDVFINLKNSTVLSSTATQQIIQMENGLQLKIIGTGFEYDSNQAGIGGLVKSLKITRNDGALVEQIDDINASLASVYAHFDESFVTGWLLKGNDKFVGTSKANNYFFGSTGNDTFFGGALSDGFMGGEGKDTYNGGAGTFDKLDFSDALWNENAFRGIHLDATKGTVIDPYGNSETFVSMDVFEGTQFADVMLGSAANETFQGRGGADTIDGKSGFDIVRYRRGFDNEKGVTVNLTSGVAIDQGGSADKLSNIDGVVGSEFKDKITGNAGFNDLRGRNGSDTLDGAGGADLLQGGAGNDTYIVDNAKDRVDEVLDGGSGKDTVKSSVSFSLSPSTKVVGDVENLTLLGTAAINAKGNALANVLVGNGAANTLAGGLGNDTLRGGAGKDVFLFNTTPNTISNKDKITDFKVIDDTIQLENAVFSALGGVGTLRTAQFVTNTTGTAADRTDRVIYETDSGKLFYDKDGTGAAESVHFATVGANLKLTFADVFIV